MKVLRGHPHQVAAVADSLSSRAQVHVGGHRLGTGGQPERGANWPGGGRVRENRLGGPGTGPHWQNHENGWSRPDDPERARDVREDIGNLESRL